MSIVFVHGVNTREGKVYRKEVAARDVLMRRLLVAPLAEQGVLSADTPILNPYWGGHGVRFRWDHASVPDVQALEHLGGASEATPESDAAFADLVASLGGNGAANAPGGLEALGGSDGPLQRAAKADLPRLWLIGHPSLRSNT